VSFKPLYQRVQERIREEILAAQAHDARLPTERELQARYQVSRPTISKALTALAAEGLLIKSQGRGSFLLFPPESPGQTSTPPRRIGYVAPLTGEALVQRAFRGIDRAAHRRDYRVLMGSAGNSVAREQTAVHELVASGVRGLIIYPVPRRGAEAQRDYLRTEAPDIPLVLIDTCVPEQGHTQLIFDNRRAGYAMTHWLIGKGHSRIGLISYPEEIFHAPLAARLKGYRDALRDHGLPFDPALVRRFETAEHQRGPALAAIFDEWMSLAQPPDAVIASDDIVALEVNELLAARSVRVPEQMRVVGFDNREAARRYHPPFTTTNPDFERMGEMACDLLLDGIEAGELPSLIYVLDVPLLVRRCAETHDVVAQPRERATL